MATAHWAGAQPGPAAVETPGAMRARAQAMKDQAEAQFSKDTADCYRQNIFPYGCLDAEKILAGAQLPEIASYVLPVIREIPEETAEPVIEVTEAPVIQNLNFLFDSVELTEASKSTFEIIIDQQVHTLRGPVQARVGIDAGSGAGNAGRHGHHGYGWQRNFRVLDNQCDAGAGGVQSLRYFQRRCFHRIVVFRLAVVR